jgi:DNA repair protein RecN (Recombination protein N)
MLVELTVHNLVIVEKALLRPGEGLIVMSGETGAGKSLILDAIDILSGARIRAGLIGRWDETASVGAVFQVETGRAERIAEIGHVPVADGQVILRRKVSDNGRSQAWINDCPVTVATLRAVSALLIDLHAQHEPIRLADPAVQLQLLDAFGGLQAQAGAYTEAHLQALQLAKAFADCEGGERERAREIDYLGFQLKIFADLNPQAGEFARLEERHALLSSAGDWSAQAAQAVDSLVEQDKAVVTIVSRLQRRLSTAPDPLLRQAGEHLAEAVELLREAAAACGTAAERIAVDPAELERIGERLNRWQDLMRKHGPDEAAVLAAWTTLGQRLADLSGVDERRSQLAAELAQTVTTRDDRGRDLALARRAAFARLATEVHAHLAELGMPKAKIHLSEQVDPAPTALGLIRQEILVATNPGQAPGSIREIASGGEAARLMLAISAALAAVDDVPLMVFDEVDSGVGGRLGLVIGGKLARLATGRTVLAVTHTPQVAACGSTHYVVRKHQGEESTTVEVSLVSDADRREELADMLGGGGAARDQARELLAAAHAGAVKKTVKR